jgi:hypothetical protein
MYMKLRAIKYFKRKWKKRDCQNNKNENASEDFF